MKIETKISDEFEEICIQIQAPSLTEEVKDIVRVIAKFKSQISNIIATKDNRIFPIELEDVICFYSKERQNFVKTMEDTYEIQYKLYELEEVLADKGFIRISNSCIINIGKVKCFDTSMIGTIDVIFKDNTKKAVSRRKVKEIMKIIKEKRKII